MDSKRATPSKSHFTQPLLAPLEPKCMPSYFKPHRATPQSHPISTSFFGKMPIILAVLSISCEAPSEEPLQGERDPSYAIWPLHEPDSGLEAAQRNPWLDPQFLTADSGMGGAEGSNEAPLLPEAGDVSEQETPPETVIAGGQPIPKLMLHAYLEGTGSQKALVVHNAQASHPEDCELLVYANGGEAPWRRIPLENAWNPDGDLILCTSTVDTLPCTSTMSSSFNGNDAIELRCGSRLLDSLGKVGNDPGAYWSSPTNSGLRTKDAFLVRCEEGDPDIAPQDAVNLDDAWTVGDINSPLWPQRCFTNAGAGGATSEELGLGGSR